jgi:creatinine amidohydrolase
MYMVRMTLIHLLLAFNCIGSAFGETNIGQTNNENKGAYLGRLTWPEAEQRLKEAPVVIIPFAAGAKQHGPHLPMDTDQLVMQYLLDQAVLHQNVIVVPPVLHGWFPAFRDYPGTGIADAALFTNYVQSIAESLVSKGASRIVFLNLGIMKATGLPLGIAAREIRARYNVPTLLVNWEDLETTEVEEFTEQQRGGHADEVETSILLYLDASIVQMEKARRDYREKQIKNYPGYRPGVFSRDPNDPAFSAEGVFGAPELASADKGRMALELMTRNWLEALAGFAAERPGPKNNQ